MLKVLLFVSRLLLRRPGTGPEPCSQPFFNTIVRESVEHEGLIISPYLLQPTGPAMRRTEYCLL